jgi:hypothetical protein
MYMYVHDVFDIVQAATRIIGGAFKLGYAVMYMMYVYMHDVV